MKGKDGRHLKRMLHADMSYNISRPWVEFPASSKIAQYLSMQRRVLKNNKKSRKRLQAKFTKDNGENDKIQRIFRMTTTIITKVSTIGSLEIFERKKERSAYE